MQTDVKIEFYTHTHTLFNYSLLNYIKSISGVFFQTCRTELEHILDINLFS